MKSFINKNKGITLIALIITILVMLILAVVSISAVIGDNGVMTRAEKSGEEQRYATVKDHRDLWWSSLKVAKFGEDTPIQTLDELVEDLKVNGVITNEEKEFILDNGYVTIAEKNIEFYEPGEKEGKYVQYDGRKWIILYDDSENGLQMVSEEAIGEFSLGIKDPTLESIDDEELDVNEDGVVTKLDKAIYSYNNSAKTLNDICKGLVKNSSFIKYVRSVGTSSKEPYNDDTYELYGISHQTDNLKSWDKKIKIYEDNRQDYNLMRKYKCEYANNEYWYVRRFVDLVADKGDYYSIRINYVDSYLQYAPIAWIRETLDHVNEYSKAVRPVVVLESYALEQVEGEGTKDNPYILD